MNVKIIGFLGILVIILFANQVNAQIQKDTIKATAPKPGEWIVYEQEPKFPGGLEKFQEFIQSNLKSIAGAAGKRAIVTFVVEKDGTLKDIEVVKGINEEADEEARRVIRLSPKWQPAKQAGKLMRVAYSVPVKFN